MEYKEALKFSEIKRLSFINSKEMPSYIKFTIDGKIYYYEWMGWGFTECEPTSRAVEVMDD